MFTGPFVDRMANHCNYHVKSSNIFEQQRVLCPSRVANNHHHSSQSSSSQHSYRGGSSVGGGSSSSCFHSALVGGFGEDGLDDEFDPFAGGTDENVDENLDIALSAPPQSQ